ncbi:hypothetical protein QP303_24055, partial [Escherichia coli]|nr:hypothetical protein [Escherichia coli]
MRRLARGEDPLALAHHGAQDDDAKTTEFLPAAPSDAETRVTPAQQATPAPVPAPAPTPEPEKAAA